VAEEERRLRVLGSGATELWAADVRQGSRMAALGDAALEVERPLHVAQVWADQTVCGESVSYMREYPVEFDALDEKDPCPACDEWLGHPRRVAL